MVEDKEPPQEIKQAPTIVVNPVINKQQSLESSAFNS